MENDNEIKGVGNSVDFGARMLDPRLGRWFATDPLSEKYPEWTPYNYVYNNPIRMIDPTGMEGETWDGDYYGKNGEYLGSDNEDDDKVYVADKKNEDGTFKNAKDLGVNHSEFIKAAGKLKKESSGDKTETLWLAHTANNATKNIDLKKGNNVVEQMLSNYSTANASEVKVTDNSNTSNYARAALIDVLNGGADPTGGANLWDGQDLLKKGLKHNKYNEYGYVFIKSEHLTKFINNQKQLYNTKVSWEYLINSEYGGTTRDWGKTYMGDFMVNQQPKSNGKMRKTYYNLISVGVQGGTIFWRAYKKKSL